MRHFALEHLNLRNTDQHVERPAAPRAALALPGEAQPHAVLDAGGNLHVDLALNGHAALAPAVRARFLEGAPPPAAGMAGARDHHEGRRLAELPRAPARRTTDSLPPFAAGARA